MTCFQIDPQLIKSLIKSILFQSKAQYFLHLFSHFKCLNLSGLYLIKRQSCHHIETNQLICSANQLTGFYMMATLAFIELIRVQGQSPIV